MKRFRHGQRVVVRLDHLGREIGLRGTVVRLGKRADDAAWIALDTRHRLCPFPEDDERRCTHVMACPGGCDPPRLAVTARAQRTPWRGEGVP